MATFPAKSLVYGIDRENRIISVNDAWIDFASANGGMALLPEHIMGRDLLTAFSDPTLRQLYSAMIEHAWKGSRVQFDYRCDVADKRRTFTMEIRQGVEGVVEFVSTLRLEEVRPPVALLMVGLPRDQGRFVRMCSWCQQVALPDGQWVEVETAVAVMRLLEDDLLPMISHGMCPACFERMARKWGR